jgi:putative transposase
MKGLFPRLLLYLATGSAQEPVMQLLFAKVQMEIMRSQLPRQIPLTPQERTRLIKFGKPLGSKVKELLTIVSPRTFARWLSRERARRNWSEPGRRRKPEEIRELILRLARDNSWGYKRIAGELRKLGIRQVSPSTIRNILRENGLDPGPKRGEGTWHDFIKQHTATLWACDFFTKKVWTMRGLVDVYVLFFMHIGSRRVYVAGMTPNPDRAWMVQQARNMAIILGDQSQPARYLLRDFDGKFPAEFDSVLASSGTKVKKVGPIAPNLNAFAERWVRSIREECLNHFVVFGEEHLAILLLST